MTLRAREVMEQAPVTVPPDLSVRDLAALLLREHLDGVCVVENGDLLGVATTMDLVFQSQPPHLPSFFHFLEALIPLENTAKVEHDLKKIAGATVRDVMTTKVVTAGPETSIHELAETMVGRHVSLLPIVDTAGKLLGVVTKAAILRKAYAIE
jgi:CBS domain-containing protein